MSEKQYDCDIPLARCSDCPMDGPHFIIRDHGIDERGERFLIRALCGKCGMSTFDYFTRPSYEKDSANCVADAWNGFFAKFGVHPRNFV